MSTDFKVTRKAGRIVVNHATSEGVVVMELLDSDAAEVLRQVAAQLPDFLLCRLGNDLVEREGMTLTFRGVVREAKDALGV